MKCKYIVRWLITGIILTVWISFVSADVPYLINYRGHIADKPGTQNFQILFNLYDQADGGTLLWSETQPVDLFDGNFAVILGSVVPLTPALFASSSLFLGVQVVGEDELIPRQQIVSVPFAMSADLIDGLDSTQIVRPYTSTWLKSVGISQTDQTRNLYNLLDIEVTPSDSNGRGITIQGTPSAGDMGIRLNNGGTGGEKWMIDSTNDSSTHFGGGKLAFFHFESMLNVITTGENTPQSVDSQPNAAGGNPIPIVIDPPVLESFWVDVMVLDGKNNRVGIKTASPNYTLDVRGTIGNSGVQYHSDAQWKDHVETLDDSLKKVLQLRGVEYDWKTEDFPEMNFPKGKQVGLIAQEVEKVIPEVVSTADDGTKSIDYARMVPLLIESIKNQQQQIQDLQAEIERLKETEN